VLDGFALLFSFFQPVMTLARLTGGESKTLGNTSIDAPSNEPRIAID
jgi:hypothetical protein